MSVKVMGLVWDYYPEGGGELLTMLKLADHADHDGSKIWPSVARTAEMTRQSERTVQRQIKAAVDIGWLEVVEEGGRGPYSTTRYRIPVERIPHGIAVRVTNCHPSSESEPEKADITRVTPATAKGDIHDNKGDTAMSPESSLTSTVLNRQAETQKPGEIDQGQNRPPARPCAKCGQPMKKGNPIKTAIGDICHPCEHARILGKWTPEETTA
jgi:hypothetical protein